MKMMSDVMCKGDIRLGTACAKCSRCFDAQRLRADAAEAENRVLRHSNASFLETVAKVCDLLGIDLDDAKHADGQPSDVLFSHAKGQAEKLAAAEQRFADLLLILRNPTGAMVEAGNNSASVQMEHDSELGSYAWIDNSAEVLSAMLDAALNPNPEA